ncbi:AraC family transcriptional regulator [Pseudomonas putida]|uniref:AraC family transcriptional regulator n=1 Tax=Pseudomonas putida TaxID=303 RepID=UPI0007DC08A5|nr:helix-turn-helix transcriptional regulator [Pseudomonas putida]OAS04567.1 AraC family transcriptional regulator [Pseudomonas putida]
MVVAPVLPAISSPLPHSILLRTMRLTEVTSYPTERHDWGEFVYSFSGVIELTVDNREYLTPPHYGLWLPPRAEHDASTRPHVCYCVLDIAPERCARLPTEVCTLAVGPITKAILADLVERQVDYPRNDEDTRLMQVLVDQISMAPRRDTYLPISKDRALSQVLEALHLEPGDNRPLDEWASVVHSTERTLSRRCKRDLGMSFVEWRQRLRLVRALSMLEDGIPVQTVALELGYSSSSAFIAMFHRMIGSTPDEFRKRVVQL